MSDEEVATALEEGRQAMLRQMLGLTATDIGELLEMVEKYKKKSLGADCWAPMEILGLPEVALGAIAIRHSREHVP